MAIIISLNSGIFLILFNRGLIGVIIIGFTHSVTPGITNAEVIDFAGGISISQYISRDGFVVLKLSATSVHYIGFSISGWFVNHSSDPKYDFGKYFYKRT